MTDAPERTWVTFDCNAPWSGIAYERKANADAVEYVRADVVAELDRRLGGGCEANHGGDHLVIKEGSYAFCGKCGESMRGVRYCHLPNSPSAQIENAPVQSRAEISGEKPVTP